MIRSACVVIALTVSSFLVGCSVDADDPPASTKEEKAPAVETDKVETNVARCPLPKPRPQTCQDWYCEAGQPGCPSVCWCRY